MDTHETLCAARNLIDRGGWARCYGPSRGPQCAMSAVWVSGEGRCSRERWILEEFAGESIERWNDAPGRTKAEVLDVFDRAIAATAPEPDLASLNLNVNGGRKDWNALEDVHAALREEVAR